MTRMEFRILGPLEIREGERVLPVGGPKPRALVALLLLDANRVVSGEWLVDGLWGGAPPPTAQSSLQNHVARLRRVLGDRVVTRGAGYLLRVEPEELDVDVFRGLVREAEGAEPAIAAEKLHRALALWRGAPLADLAGEPVHALAGHLDELRLAALEQRIDADLDLGRHAEVVSELEALTAEQPFRERFWAQLVLALYRSDRQGDALASYTRVRRTLVDELGSEPGAQLQELHRRVLRQDPSLDLEKRRLPTGTVTFLFTDVEGSTRLLHDLGAERYAEALAHHRLLLREAFARHGGVEVDTQGDAFFVSFASAPGALAAAAELTEALADGPLRVRAGLHTGTPLVTPEGYVGPDVHRAARIAAAAHGGQVVVSSATYALASENGWRFHDLGDHRLKDLAAPERLWQLGDGRFPPLKSLYRANLPVPQTPFLGRESELAAVSEVLARDDVRLLTLTGPGGTGKTRLALQAAGEAAESFPDGITWLALAPLRDAAHVFPTLAEALEIEDEGDRPPAEAVAAALAGKRTLLLLDNAEHLLPELSDAFTPLRSVEGPTLLVTSRERLGVGGERVYPVPTLADDEAVEMFTVRARALEPSFTPTDAVAELCARLDHLPLAVELAAARTTLFSPEQLLERVGQRLDLLKGGRDAEPRQQTLRATIAWSFDLLTPEEQELFRRLSVFVGGCTYEAAEEICDADPDTLQSLVDKSLVRRRDAESGPRYWMLETVREFASEALARSGDDTVRARHAEWYAALGLRLRGPVRALDRAARASVATSCPTSAPASHTRSIARTPRLRRRLPLRALVLVAVDRARAGSRCGCGGLAPSRRGRGRADSPARGALGVAGEIVRWTGDQDRAAQLKQSALTLARAHEGQDVHGAPLAPLLADLLADSERNRARPGPARRCRAATRRRRSRSARGSVSPSASAHATEALADIAYARRDFLRARQLLADASERLYEGGWAVARAACSPASPSATLLLGDPERARASLSRAARDCLDQEPDSVAASYVVRVARDAPGGVRRSDRGRRARRSCGRARPRGRDRCSQPRPGRHSRDVPGRRSGSAGCGGVPGRARAWQGARPREHPQPAARRLRCVAISRPARSRSCSRTSRARRGCCTSSASATRTCSPSTGACCERRSQRTAASRWTRRATRSSSPSRAPRMRSPPPRRGSARSTAGRCRCAWASTRASRP